MAGYSPKIATISGIDIELHWTFILLLFARSFRREAIFGLDGRKLDA